MIELAGSIDRVIPSHDALEFQKFSTQDPSPASSNSLENSIFPEHELRGPICTYVRNLIN